MNSAIADGVSIGKNSVIGACSFVKDDVGDNEISYGIPSRIR
jgi:acetyltransferase-like isoleucine patch superfamily enzyme